MPRSFGTPSFDIVFISKIEQDCQAMTELAGVFGRAAGVDRLMGLNARKGVAHTNTGLQPRQECSLGVAIMHLSFKK
jgi:hypothetical protein